MPRKLELDFLKAELASTKKMLRSSRKYSDPIGEFQFQKKVIELQNKIRELELLREHKASVALFFSGRPVIGSAGIKADFAGKILSDFQDIISKVNAHTNIGKIGSRGCVPNAKKAELMVTGMAKGSFGFILEELTEEGEIFDTNLKVIVEKSINIIEAVASENESDFDNILPEIDSRTLIALKDFFTKMDQNKAVVRLVEEDEEILIDDSSVHRGKERTSSTEIIDDPESISGTLLGLFPINKRFELKKDDGEVIHGSLSESAKIQYEEMVKDNLDIINQRWRLSVNIRNTKRLNSPDKFAYSILSFIEKLPLND